MALAVRALGRGAAAPPRPAAVLRMVERVMDDADARGGRARGRPRPDDARALLRAWLAAVELDLADGELIAHLQADDFSHADLYRRARPLPRAQARRGGRRAIAAAAATGRPHGRRRRARAVRGLRAGHPLRAGRRVPRPRSAGGRPPRRAGAVALSPTASAQCTASRARSTRSASAASRASTSR